jgi:hypothetical protein
MFKSAPKKRVRFLLRKGLILLRLAKGRLSDAGTDRRDSYTCGLTGCERGLMLVRTGGTAIPVG